MPAKTLRVKLNNSSSASSAGVGGAKEVSEVLDRGVYVSK